MKSQIRRFWHALRRWPPFNTPVTWLLRPLAHTRGGANFLLEHVPYFGVVRLPLPNGKVARLKSHGDDYIVNQIFWQGRYELETFRMFWALAKSSRYTIDIGAHVGIYALAGAYSNPQGKIFAFEPVAATFQRLQENVELNHLSHVESVCSAVSDHNGTAPIFYTDSPYISSNPSLRNPGSSNPTVTNKSVPVITLDHFVAQQQLPGVDFVKMDTEGTEVQVLKGMSQTLATHHPDIICEVLPGIGEGGKIEALLRPLGYHFYRLEPSGLVRCEKIEGHPTWWNYLFTVKDESALRALSLV